MCIQKKKIAKQESTVKLSFKRCEVVAELLSRHSSHPMNYLIPSVRPVYFGTVC